ncbi:hypothetical protein LOTGIDRAFT_170715 [Lottia gigantea]|uniref:RING-type domain-containing protein n=1 Tax=Lottia gigantea TaxID=225164 RepID=V4CPW4_LOTGI|nr:hypothetical protein LOTGIDRAFT_170715 [Lottia gigantea]ESP04470.1 hypothetical protein LOTGIDRAFT_170715 [Lottia gigantea]
MASYGLPTNLLFCKLCQKIYKEPKLLPCLHTYCLECLDKQTQETNRVTCSLCGYSMISPLEGVARLTTNIFAERVVKQYIDKIQEFAKTDEVTANLSNRNSVTDTEIYESLVERAKYSPNSLSLFSIQKRENSSDINMASAEIGANSTSQISHQPDLVQSHTASVDSRYNMVVKLSNHMDHKLMALQGEALRVTYAIDSINQTINDWRENRYQLKRKVEERSNMLQHQIRRHEKRLMAEIDNRYHEDKMMKDAETSKLVLRQNLKGILQTVEFLKQVQDFATDDEMINLKDRLMSCSVNISEVQIRWQELVMDIPDEPSEHLMVTDFGKLSKSEKSSVVFLPGSLEMEKDMNADENAFNDSFFNDHIFSYTTSPRNSRRFRNRSSRMSETDLETDGNMSDASVTVDQFRTMRESFKQRRRQLLEETGELSSTKEENFPILQNPLIRLNSSKRKMIPSFAGTSSVPYDNPHFLHDSQLNLEQISPLPPNASSRDITDRNEISEQMAHLSNENREDKIKRMQELRESWKRRKEFLMKNDGYISPSAADGAPVFDYEEKIEDVIEDTPASRKHSRIKQLRNRLIMIRQHFRTDTPTNSAEIEDVENIEKISTADVVRRNKPKEKKEKRWSGIFRMKDSKRKSLTSQDSKEFVLDEFDTQTLDGDEIKTNERKRTESIASKKSGLTRKKLQQMRESVRKKTQRWRTINSA